MFQTSYTDAAAASRDQGLQAGFEQGMDDARATAMRAGRLHGIIWYVESYATRLHFRCGWCAYSCLRCSSSLIHLTTIATTPTALVDELQSIYEQLYSLADGAQGWYFVSQSVFSCLQFLSYLPTFYQP
jgi:hypothetical protein